MLFYDSFGMNPRMVRFYLDEKNLKPDRISVDIFGLENRKEPYLGKNPSGQTPLLELDDGFCLSETAAICEYLEELNPDPPLIGSTPRERAETRMWWRRVEINICLPLVYGFYFDEGYEIFKDRTHCPRDAAKGMKERAQKGMEWLDPLLDGRTWIAGDRFTMADICLYVYIDAVRDVNQPMPEGCDNLSGWFHRVQARPAAGKSQMLKTDFGLVG
ncbi:glutathione S-transferase family protein [Tsuneonella sp. YG55]|uniref:Glutathione S-transferase family protein n=1 Tax=Tsuneonella litorea TaxID=2976475 RepID=A0A9X2W137_9SPHN|nr:glutathione S-transferase family protein [Tsuneonella litorea]MCT2558787.1 glutathione S-transferase family protein [Tsuneonella litorea]